MAVNSPFGGSVRFTGRKDQLDSTLSNLKLVVANRQAHFHADIEGKDKNLKAANPQGGVVKTTHKPGLEKTGATVQALLALTALGLAAGLLLRRRSA